MQANDLIELIHRVQRQRSEGQTIELKAATQGCPTRLYDTLSSFSNQNNGGVIIFGIDENAGYAVLGVYDAQDLQKKVTEQCKQMSPAVRALFTVCELDGHTVVAAEIPGVDITERPVFYKGVGRIKGSYIRVGESDEPMSEYEIYSYDAYRKRIRDDLRPVPDAKFDLLDQTRLQQYLQAVRQERKNLATNCTQEQLLELMGVTTDNVLTLAGVMTFSIYPQAYFPQLCITAVRIEGTQMGDLGEVGERFIDNQRITGAIPDMLDDATAFVRRNSRTMTIIDADGKRADISEYPVKAVREAILNALIHRDYSLHSETTPITIEMYNDRMEITNSGGLYGRISIDSLGKVRPDTRNAALANMLELLRITENRYSGIPTIRREMEHAGLPAPVFSVTHGEFHVTLYNNASALSRTMDPADPISSILTYCRTPRSRNELQSYVGMSRAYVMKKYIQPLLNDGKLRMTLPDKPQSSFQRYVTVD